MFSRDLTVLSAHPAFIRQRNEPYLPLLSQPKLVLIYRPRRDGRLSWPWLSAGGGADATRQSGGDVSLLCSVFAVFYALCFILYVCSVMCAASVA